MSTATTLSPNAQKVYSQIGEEPKMGDLKKIAKEIKRDHDLAMELWDTGEYYPRMLAVLIMDKKLLSEELVDQLDKDLQKHDLDSRVRIADWFMANQLMKDKKTIEQMLSWENSPSPLKRRLFWYYQARLRWTGQTPPDNTEHLLSSLEDRLAKEEPEVQWAMNFTAAQIGIFDQQYRKQCVEMGLKFGLYKDEVVPKNCTPNYLPEFIRIEVEKRK